MNSKKVLAIFAHPDDGEQFCGGTLILLKQKGYQIVIAALTNGECGSPTLSPTEIVKIRQKEAKKGSSIIGADYLCLEICDGTVSYDLETTKKIVKLLRDYQPEIVFTHPTIDYMTDHAHCGQLLLWAIPEATHKNFPVVTHAKALSYQPYLYHSDPQGLIGDDGQIVKVNTIVDISTVVEKKLKAFSSHQSQVKLLSKTGKNQIDAVEKTRRWAITRGQQVRVSYGEGFNQQLLEQYPRQNILVKILADKVFTL